jgi:two-component sensor histidine kinase
MFKLIIIRRGRYCGIEDNGIGMPVDIKTSGLNTLGMQLMTGLSKDIDAQFNIYSKKGTKVTVIFNIKIKSTDSNSIHNKVSFK